MPLQDRLNGSPKRRRGFHRLLASVIRLSYEYLPTLPRDSQPSTAAVCFRIDCLSLRALSEALTPIGAPDEHDRGSHRWAVRRLHSDCANRSWVVVDIAYLMPLVLLVIGSAMLFFMHL